MREVKQGYISQLPRANDSIVLYSMLPAQPCLAYTRHIRHLDHRYLYHRRHLDEKSKRSEPLRMLTSETLQPSKWIAETMIDPCCSFSSSSFSCMLQVGVAEGAPYALRQVAVRCTVFITHARRVITSIQIKVCPLAKISLRCREFHAGLVVWLLLYNRYEMIRVYDLVYVYMPCAL